MKSISSFSSLSPLTSSSDLENEDSKSSCLVYTPPYNQRRRRSYRANIGGLGLAALLYDQPSHHHDPPHFLDSCFLCKRRIGRHCDIFMYRGNIPFCSEECRQEQIEKDEEEERVRSLSLKMKSHTLKQKTKEKKGINTGSPPKSQTNNVHLRTGSVAVAG